MPADRPNIGTGRRRQGRAQPDVGDDRNRSLERALDEELETIDPELERGHEAGAHGDRPPHRVEKPAEPDIREV